MSCALPGNSVFRFQESFEIGNLASKLGRYKWSEATPYKTEMPRSRWMCSPSDGRPCCGLTATMMLWCMYHRCTPLSFLKCCLSVLSTVHTFQSADRAERCSLWLGSNFLAGTGWDNVGLISTMQPTPLPRYHLVRVIGSNCASSLHDSSIVGLLRYTHDDYERDELLGTFLGLCRS